jgi:signal transduction histidine kinase
MTAPSIIPIKSIIALPIETFFPAVPEVIVVQPVLLTAAFAHEIRNPLTNINLAIEMLQEHITDDVQKSYLDIIMRASAKINLQVSELVKQEQHPEQLIPKKYSMNHLLDDVLLMAKDRLHLKNILVCRVYTARDYVKTVDITEMKIALTNIVINAIDAMKENGQLKLTTQFIGGNYTIQIEDDGCGISAENLKQIFVPYYTNKKNGLGIGLAATKDIFKSNKITVTVESIEGFGTKFIMSFPRQRTIFLINKAV